MSSIEQILNSPERLKANLSSPQFIRILDTLIMGAVRPIIVSMGILSAWAAEMLCYLHVDGKKRISRLEFQEQSDTLFSLMLAETPAGKERAFDRLKLDRGVTFHFLNLISAKAKSYSRLISALVEHNNLPLPMRRTAQAMERYQRIQAGLVQTERILRGERHSLQPALVSCAWYTQQALTFKHMIAEKYYRHAYKDARKSLMGTKVNADIRDLYQNYLLALYKSIDKYDAESGTLTGYLKFWLRNASTSSQFDHQNGISHSMPATRRRNLQKSGWVSTRGHAEQNIAVEIDDAVEESTARAPPEFGADRQLLLRLAAMSQGDWDVRMALIASNLDYPL